MNLSKYNKTFEKKKRGQSRSEYKRVQLPNINKTIDLVTINRYQRPQDKSITLIRQFEWVFVDKNYNQMRDQQIYKEYQELRKQIFSLNELIVRELERFKKKASRKRIITFTQPQKVHQIRQKQIQNNTFVLGMMNKQYKGLKVKSQTLQPKQAIEQQIQYTKQQISKTKQKITSLKLKNKSIGDSIMNTDQVLADLKQCQRQNDVWIKKKKQLQVKLDKVNTQTQKVVQNLDNIITGSTSAEQYFKNNKIHKKQQIQKNTHFQTYNQKLHSLQVLKKNHQIFYALKQQKYHQLLKLLQTHVQKEQKMKLRTHEIDFCMVQFIDEVQSLENKLKHLKHQNSTMGFYHSSILDHSPERSIDSNQSLSNHLIKPNPRLSLFIQKRDQTISSQKTSTNNFIKNQLPITAHEKGYDKMIRNQINHDRTSQFKLNLSIPVHSHLSVNVKPHSSIPVNSQQGQKIQGKSQIMGSTEIGKISKNIPISSFQKHLSHPQNQEIHSNLYQSPSNVYSQPIQVNENSTEKETVPIHQKENQNAFSFIYVDQNTLKKPSNPQQHSTNINQQISKNITQKHLENIHEQNSINLALRNSQNKEKQYQNLSEQIRQMINKKPQKSIQLQPKLTIDLEKIEENIQKVSQSRMRAKQQLTSNFAKYVNSHQQKESREKTPDS